MFRLIINRGQEKKHSIEKVISNDDICGIQVVLKPIYKKFKFGWLELYLVGNFQYFFQPDKGVMPDHKRWFQIDRFINNLVIDSKLMHILATHEDSRDEMYLFLNNCIKH